MELNHLNKDWMRFFNEERHLWTPVAEEWQRLSEEYKTQQK